jgi:hypothetical protein
MMNEHMEFVRDEFMRDFQEFMNKWRADIEIDYDERIMEIYLDGIYDQDGETLRPYTWFSIGSTFEYERKNV